MLFRTATASVLALWIPSVAMAGEEQQSILTIGDLAPTIEVEHWVKGRPIDGFETGNIYVVEFWATWCGPCRAVIPHMSDLSEQNKDYNVTFLGVSDEKLQKVVKFLCTADSESVLWNEKMRYNIAADPDRSVHGDYMRPAARTTIPTAFIVGKDSRIEWIGNPHQGFDEALDRIIRDDWDRDSFRIEYEERVAPVRARLVVQKRVDAAAKEGDWQGAIAAIDTLDAESTDRASLQMRLFRKMLKSADNNELTFSFGHRLMKSGWDNVGTLNSLAWFTAIEEDNPTRNLDFAIKAAERACEIGEWKNGGIIDSLARAYFEKGDVSAAIKYQRQAVEVARNEDEAKNLREALIRYEKAAAGRD